jgi:hypothetical protein
MKLAEKTPYFPILSQTLYWRHPQDSKFQNSVGPIDSGNQNFSFLALRATARDRLIFFLSLKSCYLSIKSPKKWKSTKYKIHFSRHHEANKNETSTWLNKHLLFDEVFQRPLKYSFQQLN